MSLFGTIQIANSTLLASQIGLQVAGNNIANANTPGFIRQEAVLTPGPTQVIGELPLGLGVRVEGIVQKADRFLSERLRNSISDLKNSEMQEDFYLQLEAIIGELGDTDLSSSLNRFFSSVHDVLNQPEDLALRNLAALEGETLTGDMHRLDSRLRDLRGDINDDIVGAADDLNRLLTDLADLNVKIVATEGGTSSSSDAVGLRDQREQILTELASIISIRAVEQPSGSVTVFAGGDFLVFEGEARRIVPRYSTDRGISAATLHIKDSDAPINSSGGSLTGLYASRDEILGGFLDDLADFSATLTFEFNKVFSSGQGLSGYRELTSQEAVSNISQPLDQIDLQHAPVNGSFQVSVRNTRSGLVETHDIFVDLNGLDNDTSLEDLAASLDAIDGLTATITPAQRLQLTSDSDELEFSFANDTSSVLAALGVNTFFAGDSPLDYGVSDIFKQDPGKFAASQGGIGLDADNAALLANLSNTPLESQEDNSISTLYEAMISRVTQASAVTHSVSEGFRVFQRTLEGQQMALSGVSIDDEAVKIISYQRMYQASARLISTVDELLATLINL